MHMKAIPTKMLKEHLNDFVLVVVTTVGLVVLARVKQSVINIHKTF